MLAMLLAYDTAGDVVATLDHLVAQDHDGNVIGLIDFEAHERAGGSLTDIWQVAGAAGSGTWPEWLGARAHDFRVKRAGDRIVALVHRTSGQRRERAAIEDAIEARRAGTPDGEPVDLRDIVGGPVRPLALDEQGRTASRAAPRAPALPIFRPTVQRAPRGSR